jgi:predicted enzyme related to lactoylglutathione lyase
MGNPVVHWEIGAKDQKKIAKFFQDLFGWQVKPDEKMHYALMTTNEPGGINGGIWQTEPGVQDYLTFYVMVDDLQAYLDKAVKLGGKIHLKPMVIPGVGTYAMFKDPEGHMVGLFKP